MQLISILFLLISLGIEGVLAVSDAVAEPLSKTKWFCGVCSVVFVFVLMPNYGREGMDPVIAYTATWVIMGCWILYGIAN